MAHTKVTKTYSQNTGAANTFSYSGSFDTFKATEVVVELDNVALTYTASTINESASPREYTVDYTNKTVHIGGADLSSGTVVIKPVTDLGSPTPRATYTPGASITSEDLNNNQKQLLRRAMEYEEQVMFKTGGTFTGDVEIGEDKVLKFEGATADGYETTLTVTDPTADRTITLPNVTGTVVTTGDTGTVTATMLAADSVDSSELVDGSIDASHISSNAVTTAKIANDNVTGAKIADDSIDSEHYVDGSIDTAHIADSQITTAKIGSGQVNAGSLASDAVETAKIVNLNVTTAKIANDAITGAKIADDAIDSEHYTDGSIDTAHIADLNVTTAKIAADAITGAKIADDAIDSEHYTDGSIDTAHIGDSQITSAKILDGTIVNADISGSAAIDHTKLAAVSSGNILVGNGSNQAASVAMSGDVAIAAGGATTIQANAVEIGMLGCEQTTISDSDSHIPTSGAVVDYVTDRIGPIGGLEVIADDESFPNTIPPTGVVISITDAAGLQVNSSGVSTNGDALDNSTITINGFPSELRGGVGSNADPYVFGAGAGLMVVSTGSSHTYNYHQALIRESDFVNLSDDINDFNNRYRIASSAPSSDNDEGDLYFNTSTNKMNVYDGSAWGEVTSVGDYKLLGIKDNGQAYNGTGPTFNGSNDQYDLFDGSSDANITSAGQLLVVLNGVLQKPNASYDASGEGFALDGSDGIRFCDPPASGSTLFITQIGSATTVNVPADNSVTSAKIQDGAVATADLAADAVTGAKIADDAVGAEHIETLDANLVFADSVEARFGAGADLKISHNGSDNISYIIADGSQASPGHLVVKNADGNVYIQADGNVYIGDEGQNETSAVFTDNGAVELYNDNAKKLETWSDGIAVYGPEGGDAAVYIWADEGDDAPDKWRILAEQASSTLKIQNYAASSYETNIECNGNGNVELNYDNSKKLETTTNGITVTGRIDAAADSTHDIGTSSVRFANGYFDTVYGDGSNLTGISTGVTSDGQQNTVAGTNAGDSFSGTNANNNSLYGYDAGTALTTGDENTFIGHSAGEAINIGGKNTCLGFEALKVSQDLSSCTVIGYQAGVALAGGSSCTFVGAQCAATHTGGLENTAVGQLACSGSSANAGTGRSNSVLGWKAGEKFEGAAYNCIIGAQAAGAQTTANSNTIIGYYGAAKLTTGGSNTLVGSNVASAQASGDNFTGADNCAFGVNALNKNTSGNGNHVFGYKAGHEITTGDYNLCLGNYAGHGQITTADNQLYIARGNAAGGGSAVWVYGDTDGSCIQGDNSSSWSTTSDERLKKNIVNNTKGLSVIDNVKVRNFEYRVESEIDRSQFTVTDTKDDNGDYLQNLSLGHAGTRIGVIAQELESVAPRCVKTDHRGVKTVDPDDLFWNLVTAVQELSTKNDALEARLATLEAK